MPFILVAERRLTKDELDAYRYLDRLGEQRLPRRRLLQLIASAGLLTVLPTPRIIRVANAQPVNPWEVIKAAVEGLVRNGNQIPAEITLANPSPQPRRARVLLEYFLPSGLSGQRGARTVNLPADYQQSFNHNDFRAREVGESRYEATASQDGSGSDDDQFEVS